MYNNRMFDSSNSSFNNSDNENSQEHHNERMLHYESESQFHNIPIQYKYPYPKSTMIPENHGKFIPKHVIPPHPSIFYRPPKQVYPPLHNFNPINHMNNQFTVKRHAMGYIPQPMVKGYPIPINGPPIPHHMIKQYMFNRPIRSIVPQQPIQCDGTIDIRMGNNTIQNHKHTLLLERANQCSLIYSAIRDRNVFSFLGLETNKRILNNERIRMDDYGLPYNEIKIQALWRYIESWRGNMFELSNSMANDGYKVAISPSTLTLLSSIIEMRLIDILSELIKIANGNPITIDHLRTCLHKNPMDIGLGSMRKIERLHANMTRY